MTSIALTPELQELKDWVDQPAPEFPGDTHALHFFLASTRTGDTVAYQGLMFYKHNYPESRYHGPHLVGTGHAVPGPDACAKWANPGFSNWARVSIALGHSPTIVAGVGLYDGVEAPANLMAEFENDVSVPFATNMYFSEGFFLTIRKTTVLIA